VSDKTTDQKPSEVRKLEQGGQTPGRRDWVERVVWSERMLEALEHGVKGNKWYSLMDKVWHPTHLQMGAWQVLRNDGAPGVDHRSCEQMEQELSSEVARLERRLREGTYRPQAVKRVWIEKAGRPEKRPLGIPTVRDRVVQMAAKIVIEPIFEADFQPCSYGFRPRRSATQALEAIRITGGQRHYHVVDADIQGFFDAIDQELLMEKVAARISDRRVLKLLRQWLRA
jgi:RNA-directed DNA polymerase